MLHKVKFFFKEIVVFWLVNTSSSNNKTNHDMWRKQLYLQERVFTRETVSNKNIGLVIE